MTGEGDRGSVETLPLGFGLKGGGFADGDRRAAPVALVARGVVRRAGACPESQGKGAPRKGAEINCGRNPFFRGAEARENFVFGAVGFNDEDLGFGAVAGRFGGGIVADSGVKIEPDGLVVGKHETEVGPGDARHIAIRRVGDEAVAGDAVSREGGAAHDGATRFVVS